MAVAEPHRIKTISELHRLMNLPRPEHPLISVINLEAVKGLPGKSPGNMVFDFYSISLKRHCDGKFKYGQQQYDFQDGIMYFMAPGQVFGRIINYETKASIMSGLALYIRLMKLCR